MAVWRALGDTGPAGGRKARQKCIEAMRTETWLSASKGGREERQGERQDLGTPNREE